MIRNDEVFKIGKIIKSHGIRGEVEMECISDAFESGSSSFFVLEIDGILVPFFWEEYRFKNQTVAIVLFNDIDNGEKASELVGCNVFYPKSETVLQDMQILSWKIFEGYQVHNQNNDIVGTIEAVDDRNDNIVITVLQATGKECLLPLHKDLLIDCDHNDHVLKLFIADGLLNLN